MTYVQANWKWYVAQYVVSFREESTNKIESHIHCYLLQANTPEEAYTKAIDLGGTIEDRFRDDDGNIIEEKCLGLHDLDILQDEDLLDGTHLASIQAKNICGNPTPVVRKKEELSLFDEYYWKSPIFKQG